MIIERKYTFSAAHRLDYLPPEHKCHRLHGHTYSVVVTIEGPVSPATGFVLDFADLDSRWKALVHPILDHHYLNEVEGLSKPTSEYLAEWIYSKLQASLADETASVHSIYVSETPYSGALYRRP